MFAVTTGQHNKAAAIRKAAPDVFEQLHKGETDLRKGGRIARKATERERIENLPVVLGQYATIVADPPWPYDNTGSRGAAADHYETMTLEQIAALHVHGRPVVGLALEAGAHLYLWVPSAFLAEGHGAAVARAWGFEPKCVLTWVKLQVGIGNWFRSATEHVLFCVRGNLPLATEDAIPTWFQADRRDHSEKPEEFFALVERASPTPRLELFARKPRDGWEVWGDELT